MTHKLIQWLNDYTNDGGNEEAMKSRFMRMDNKERTTELQTISSWLEEDGSSLREKAQLVKLGRELNHLHQSLRKVGR